ncbi:acyltransferase family protein [Caulobacter segnis]|uniref:acyltransferase family protein n=1 Tax=Caulobacter segnis TaxID=88688 RepID=UPI00240F572A|nr:acyltransferase family protein [Caulobacter segnis]MDG2520351.1 acyltransferase family protein [Caulobacter segnis]
MHDDAQAPPAAAAPGGYRPDIDGLRAVAVIPVVLFHAGFETLSGGYVGVDVFFVISGFLITSILRSDLDKGRYSLAGFYERRARRILPALFACLAATFLTALVLLPPGELEALGKSAVWVAIFASNIFFFNEGGYFGRAAEDMPLLHTWSLSVEEQFYIVWPILLALLVRHATRRRMFAAVLGLGALSLAASVWMVGRNGEAAFYLAPYRAWELLLGAGLAMGMAPRVRPARLRAVLAAAGLGLIVWPMLAYEATTPFPGFGAIPPCLGAALLLHVGRDAGPVTRLLSSKAMVGVGLISYSLYLWHWPVLVLGRVALNRDFEPAEAAAAVTLAFLLAWLSWRYVERPFRTHVRLPRPDLKVLGGAAAGLAVLAGAGASAALSDGFRQRAAPGVAVAEAAGRSINPRRARCHVDSASGAPAPAKACTPGGEHAAILLWGDSHADHFAPAVYAFADRLGVPARQASKSSCRPVLTDGRVAANVGVMTADCAAFNEAVLTQAAANPDLKTVVLAGWWIMRKGAEADGGRGFERAATYSLTRMREALGPDVEIVVLGSTPAFDFWPAQCLSRARQAGRDEKACRVGTAINAKEARDADAILARIAARTPGVRWAPLWDDLCDGARCATILGGAVLLRDHNHFTVEGGQRLLSPKLAQLSVAREARSMLHDG